MLSKITATALLGNALLAGLLLLAACAPRLRTEAYFPEMTRGETPAAAPAPRTNCTAWEGYVPDPGHPERLPVRYLRVNFHIMNSRDSSHNFRPDAARAYFRRLLADANDDLDTNHVNWRSPEGTPALPKQYRLVLWPQPGVPGDDGFYFHYDDSLYYFVSQGKNQNNYSRHVIDKYAVGRDSIINIFVQAHPDDSIRSKTYKSGFQGIALGNAVKMAGIFENADRPRWICGSLNHEIGHLLGLSHAWQEDGCPDTQNHPNKCWTWEAEGPCRDQASNNMMDYNGYKDAMTPCQIARVQATLANEKSPMRRMAIPTWCARNPAHDVVVRDSASWTGARDLEGWLTVADGGVLRLSCRLSLPAGARLTVEPGGLLLLDGCRLHNACGQNWSGIFVQEKNGRRGTVRILTPPVLENIQGQAAKGK